MCCCAAKTWTSHAFTQLHTFTTHVLLFCSNKVDFAYRYTHHCTHSPYTCCCFAAKRWTLYIYTHHCTHTLHVLLCSKKVNFACINIHTPLHTFTTHVLLFCCFAAKRWTLHMASQPLQSVWPFSCVQLRWVGTLFSLTHNTHTHTHTHAHTHAHAHTHTRTHTLAHNYKHISM
jgi:hypothetical protein